MTNSVTNLDEVLLRHVEQQTSRRVRNLSVEVVGEQVVLRGRANSFHVKQLAQHGIRSLLPLAPLRNAIVVD